MENQTSDVDMTSSQIREQWLATKWVILQRFDKCWAKNKNKIKNPIKATYISRYTHVTRLGVPPTDHYPISIYKNIRNVEYLKFRLFFFFLVKVAMPNLCYFYLVQTACWRTVGLGGEREAERRGDGGGDGGREKCTSVTMWLLPKPCRRNAQTEQRALWSVRFGGFLSTLASPRQTHSLHTANSQNNEQKNTQCKRTVFKSGGKKTKKGTDDANVCHIRPRPLPTHRYCRLLNKNTTRFPYHKNGKKKKNSDMLQYNTCTCSVMKPYGRPYHLPY